MSTEYAAKNLLHMSTEYAVKNLLFLEFLNIHERTKTVKFFKKHIAGTHMGSKATTTNF
jgi:hypothetical protein